MVQSRQPNRIVLSSDEEDGGHDASSTPKRKEGGERRRSGHKRSGGGAGSDQASNKNHVRVASLATSTLVRPSEEQKPKPRSSRSSNEPKASKNKSLHSFFSPPSDIPVQPKLSKTHEDEPEAKELDDLIEDDTSSEDNANEGVKSRSSSKGILDRKRSWSVANEEQRIPSKRPPQGPKFLKPNGAAHGQTSSAISSTSTAAAAVGPWNESYSPTTFEQLAVHPKKVADVRAWLGGAISGQLYQRLLVLKGPAGGGKSTTVTMLAKSLDASVIEWQNPDLSDIMSTEYVTWSSQFADFLSRAGQFQRLELATSSHHPDKPAMSEDDANRRVVLIEEFPSTTGSTSTALISFRTQILQFLASSTQPRNTPHVTPLIVSISESVVSNSGSEEHLTAHRLLGRDILHHPATSVIEFNAMAPTLITKALKVALQKHTGTTGRAQPVSPAVLQRLAETGDVRSAVSTLEYLCRNLDAIESSDVLAKARRSKPKPKETKKSNSSAKTQQQAQHDGTVLSLISSRESTLGLFHAIGKVVYNKRADEATVGSAWQHGQNARPPPILEPDALLSSTGGDAFTFLSALHENYILSCKSPDRPTDIEDSLEHIEGCLDALGDADVLGTGAHGTFDVGRRQGVLSEGLRQDEIAFDVGVRGMRFALPYPVKRAAAEEQPSGEKRYRPDVHRMFYPTDIKLWRARQEIKDLMDHLMNELQRGRLTMDRDALPTASKSQGGVEDFPKHTTTQPGRMSSLVRPEPSSPIPNNDGQCNQEPVNGIGPQPSRLTALLDQLPYYHNICSAVTRLNDTPLIALRLLADVEHVVRFNGTTVQRDDESEDEDMGASVIQRSQLRARQKDSAFSSHGFEPVTSFEGGVEKLVLSEDDIEDD